MNKFKSNSLEIFKDLDKDYEYIKEGILNKVGVDTKQKQLFLKHEFVNKTLNDFIGNLDGENKLEKKVDNLIDLYCDKLSNEEINEDIICFELDLPKNGSINDWMNLIDSVVELGDGKSEKFIKQSNKVLSLYKKK